MDLWFPGLSMMMTLNVVLDLLNINLKIDSSSDTWLTVKMFSTLNYPQ